MKHNFRQHNAPLSNRVELTEELRRRFESSVFSRPASELARETGLPYLLIYNIVNDRVRSVSPRNFRLIFGEDPPTDRIPRVDGSHFRRMVGLWVYLDDRTTKMDLYNELVADKAPHKADYRIFSGKIQTVERALERKMEKKFLAYGIDRIMLDAWLEEFAALPKTDRVSYQKIRPLLLFLKDHVGIHPNSILHQQMDRYESGRLKSVSQTVFERALRLKKEAERAVASADKREIERLKEKIYGKKPGYALYTAVEEELTFLSAIANKRPKRYLGRGPGAYQVGKCKRIASWRADKIHRDCKSFIAGHPLLPLESLPKRHRAERISPLLHLLVRRAADILSQKEGLVLEKQILTPSRAKTEYERGSYGFTRFDRVPTALGMRKSAFDLMVAQNCDIFRRVGKFSHRWYLSDLYLKELLDRTGFGVISAKYELLSRQLNKPAAPVAACMN